MCIESHVMCNIMMCSKFHMYQIRQAERGPAQGARDPARQLGAPALPLDENSENYHTNRLILPVNIVMCRKVQV